MQELTIQQKIAKTAQKLLIGFLIIMVLLAFLSRGLASAATPQVSVAGISGQNLMTVVTNYEMVEEKDNKKVITITVPASEQSLQAGDSIDITDLISYNNYSYVVDKVQKQEQEQDGSKISVLSTTIVLEQKEWKAGDMAAYTLHHNVGTYYSCVPLSALCEADGKYYILVLQEKETVLGKEYMARKVDVKVQAQDEDYVAIDGALEPEDNVIIDSNKTVEKGDVVRLAEESDTSK